MNRDVFVYEKINIIRLNGSFDFSGKEREEEEAERKRRRNNIKFYLFIFMMRTTPPFH
jgi:hypothetical protein